MLPYFFIPELNFNQDQFNDIINDTIKGIVNRNDISTHFKINISEHPILLAIKHKYSILGDIINVYVSKTNGGIPPHQDAARQCALNFPIQDTDNSSTIFYEAVDGEPEFIFNKKFIWNTPVNRIREVFRFTLVEPIIINNSLIHSVEYRGERCRIIASWSVLPEYSFEDAVEFFKQYPHGGV